MKIPLIRDFQYIMFLPLMFGRDLMPQPIVVTGTKTTADFEITSIGNNGYAPAKAEFTNKSENTDDYIWNL